MMKQSILYLWIAVAVLASSRPATAQTPVRIETGAGYATDVYYAFTEGEVARVPRTNWDLAFEIAVPSAVRINSGAGTAAWLYSANPAQDWETVDTTGKLTDAQALYNDPTLWQVGALNRPATDEPNDLGWGVYNLVTHVIGGNRLFVVKSVAGTYYKLWIRERANRRYQIRVARLDGSQPRELTVNTADYAEKLFAYLNLETGEVLDREPDRRRWQLLFTQYTDLVAAGPGQRLPYGVSGVLTHPNLITAQKDSIDVATFRDTTNLPWNPDINEIGYDWKRFDMASNQFTVIPNRAYFVQNAPNSVWKIVFTAFGGSATGVYEFTQQQLGNVSRSKRFDAPAVQVWPNPATAGQGVRFSQPVASVVWHDAQGRELHRSTSSGLGTAVPQLPAGLYLLNLELPDGGRESVRLLVQP
jgi:hypothetical protein